MDSFTQLLDELWDTPERLWNSLVDAFRRCSWLERSELILALGRREPSPLLVERFLGLLEEEGEVGLKTAAIEVLVRWGQRIEPALERALLTPGYRGKKFVAEIIATLAERGRFVPALITLIKEPDPNTRVSALEAISFPLGERELRVLIEGFSLEQEPMVQFAYLDLFVRLLKIGDPLAKKELKAIIPSASPQGYLLMAWLKLLSFYPPEVVAPILNRWEKVFTSPYLLEELLRWIMELPPAFQVTLLRSLKASLPPGVLHHLRTQASTPEIFEGGLLLLSVLSPQHLPDMFRSGTLPGLELFQRVVSLAPREILFSIYDLLSSSPSLQGRKLFLYLGAFLKVQRDEEEWIRLWEQYPALRPWIFRYGAELDYTWILQGLKDLFALPEEEFALVCEGLRVLTYRDRGGIVGLLSPLVEEVQLSREWVRALEVIERLGLVELRPFVERAFRRAEPEIRAQALELISEFYFEEVGPYLRLGLSDESLLVRLKALEIWEVVVSENDLSEVSALLHDPLPWVQVRALGVLIRLQKLGLKDLLPFLSTNEPCVKTFVLRLFTQMQGELPEEVLEGSLRDPHPFVVAEAIHYIEECQPDHLGDIKRFLSDPRFLVRAQSALTLIRRGEGGDLFSQLKERDPETLSYLLMGTKDDHLYLGAIFEEIYEVSGIKNSPSQYSNFRYRLEEILKAHRFRNFREFYFYLCFHPLREELLRECIEVISTGETYFYREVSSLEFFFDHLYPELRKGIPRGLPMRVYSIGCSTGEEPYTLAMLACERGIPSQEIHIIGADIHLGALKRAREGWYRPRSLEWLPLFLRNKYFQKKEDGYRISESLRPYVSFIHWNLLDHSKLPLLTPADAIFCRNLLIYFDDRSRERAVRSFEGLLKPGGVLILGHTESLLHVPTRLVFISDEKEFYYRKPKETFP